MEKRIRESSPSQHSKKLIKHALRQKAKGKRKNTAIAEGNPAPVQKHTLSPNACDIEERNCDTACDRQSSMAEVSSSVPGCSMKPHEMSLAAAQLEQTKEGYVDLETPNSILVNSNLRSLLNKETFYSLPPSCQQKLLLLLPEVDREETGIDSVYTLSESGLNNEYFASACVDWMERLAEGELTPENQEKIKAEEEERRRELDPWKLKHFEQTWGESSKELPSLPMSSTTAASSLQIKQNILKQTPPSPPVTRLRAALNSTRQNEVKQNRHTVTLTPEPVSSTSTEAASETVEVISPTTTAWLPPLTASAPPPPTEGSSSAHT